MDKKRWNLINSTTWFYKICISVFNLFKTWQFKIMKLNKKLNYLYFSLEPPNTIMANYTSVPSQMIELKLSLMPISKSTRPRRPPPLPLLELDPVWKLPSSPRSKRYALKEWWHSKKRIDEKEALDIWRFRQDNVS